MRGALGGPKGSLLWFFPLADSVHVVHFPLGASVKDHDFVLGDGRSAQ